MKYKDQLNVGKLISQAFDFVVVPNPSDVVAHSPTIMQSMAASLKGLG